MHRLALVLGFILVGSPHAQASHACDRDDDDDSSDDDDVGAIVDAPAVDGALGVHGALDRLATSIDELRDAIDRLHGGIVPRPPAPPRPPLPPIPHAGPDVDINFDFDIDVDVDLDL